MVFFTLARARSAKRGLQSRRGTIADCVSRLSFVFNISLIDEPNSLAKNLFLLQNLALSASCKQTKSKKKHVYKSTNSTDWENAAMIILLPLTPPPLPLSPLCPTIDASHRRRGASAPTTTPSVPTVYASTPGRLRPHHKNAS